MSKTLTTLDEAPVKAKSKAPAKAQDRNGLFQFRVLPGRKFNQGTDEEAKEGEVVLLTIEQAVGFCWKANPVWDTLTPVNVPSAFFPKGGKVAG